jgi:hypothetical protein
MWAVTSYFNPMGYKRRLRNYRVFRESLGIPLVAMELSFNGNFELAETDADVLIQMSGGAVLWQKERLLNVAIKSVPAHVSTIAWLDCDVIFDRSDWMDAAKRQLETHNVVQLFSDIIDLGSNDHQADVDYRDIAPCGHGIVSIVSESKSKWLDVAPLLEKEKSRSICMGMAWAARRKILEDHGLYDAMIVGSGDRALVGALYGQFEKIISIFQLNRARQEHYLKWANPYHQAVEDRVTYVPGRLYHLWHGDVESRRRGRHQTFASFNFEPEGDLSISPSGAWQWARSRPDLETFFENYFRNRAEDG